MEQTANMVARDNVELACCFIQKTAIEKAILDIDKRLATVGHGALSPRGSRWYFCTTGL